MIGIDPTSYTLRELFWMSEGRLRADWARTVSVMRITGLGTTGKEPPLAALIPARFVPRLSAPRAERVDPEKNREQVAGMIAAAKGKV